MASANEVILHPRYQTIAMDIHLSIPWEVWCGYREKRALGRRISGMAPVPLPIEVEIFDILFVAVEATNCFLERL